MTLFARSVTIVLTAATLGTAMSLAHAQNCQSLWYERNSYYKEAGYCFKTAPAIMAFGNAGCQYDDERYVPLSDAVRTRIRVIQGAELVLRCKR
jgi:hypothetical protein